MIEILIPLVRLALPWIRKKLRGREKVRRVLGKVVELIQIAESLDLADGLARLKWVLGELAEDDDFLGLNEKRQRQLVNQVHGALDAHGFLAPVTEPQAAVRETAEVSVADSTRCLTYAVEIVAHEGHATLAQDLRTLFGIEEETLEAGAGFELRDTGVTS